MLVPLSSYVHRCLRVVDEFLLFVFVVSHRPSFRSLKMFPFLQGPHSGTHQTEGGGGGVAELGTSRRYEAQLEALRSMGFTDTSKCVRALDSTGGKKERNISTLVSLSLLHTHRAKTFTSEEMLRQLYVWGEFRLSFFLSVFHSPVIE